MPSSTTPARCQCSSSWRSRSSVSGTPMSLFRLPCVANAAVAEPGAQDRRDHLRDRGLAVAAGRPRSAAGEARAPGRGQLAAARACVSATSRPGQARPRPGRARRAPPPRRPACACARKSCASKRSPFSATNRSPGCSVRVSLCTRAISHVAVADAALESRQQRMRLRQRHHASRLRLRHPSCARAPPAPRSTSENGCFTPRDFLVVLVALAGDQHHVARRRRRAIACAIAARRSSITHARVGAGRCRPRSASRMSPRRLVARVVAGDDDAVGQPLRRCAPISGRLVASRLPPQPNTHHSSPPRASASGRSAASAFSSASGVWA